MNYSVIKKIACIGIGGSGVYYVAKYFLRLGVEVYGFDIAESERTKELQALGAKIIYSNPKEPLDSDTSLYIYSPGLPNEILAQLESQNSNIQHKDTGVCTSEIIHDYEHGNLTEKEKEAFEFSEISPLYTLDQSKMTYIAVTGTDGKTSTCSMVFHLLSKLGYKPGLVSTVSAKIGNETIDTGFHTTTPTSQELFKLIKRMEDAGCTHAIIESTSHGLAMGRLAGLKFKAIAYTNITSEHLDYHKTWENYYLAKETLLTEHTTSESIVFLNKDDAKSFTRLQQTAQKLGRTHLTYSVTDANASLFANSIKENPAISFTIEKTEVTIPIIGRYNVSNALAAIGIASQITNKSSSEIAPLLNDFQTVTGRMQILQTTPFTVIVDFAHTANAIEQALTTLRGIIHQGKKLIVVFGCAGKRDDSKRIPMGAVAGKLADITIVTAEDPRSEKLTAINDLVEQGWKSTSSSEKELIRFDDESLLVDVRRQAIRKAIEKANPGDIIIIAGKAHEQSLCFGQTEYPWSDITETIKLLEESH